MPEAPGTAPDAPLRLAVGLPGWARWLGIMPVALAMVSAWSVELTLLQAVAVTLLAALPLAFADDPWQGGALVLRPDGSAELLKGSDAREATTSGRAWLLGGLSVVELETAAGRAHVVLCSRCNASANWRRLRGWIRLGRLGAQVGSRAPGG